MRLFGYYAIHSTWNQIRKIFKTWILIFILVCGLVGGIIGITVANIEEASEEYHYSEEFDESNLSLDTEEVDESDSITDAEEVFVPDSDQIVQFLMDEEGIHFYQSGKLIGIYDVGAILELAVMLILIGIMLYEVLSSDKNGSKIFLMADVNLLFASPMRPQSVLLFRLLCQIGTAILASIYLIFQIPNLVINLNMGLDFAAALMISWFWMLLTGKMLQVFLYTLCSTHVEWKKYLTPVTWGLMLLLMAAFAAFTASTGRHYLDAAIAFFNAPVTRWIPIVGWIKGYLMFMYERNYRMAACCAVLLAVGTAGLIWLIWNMKADFYEDALAKSEETAALQESVKEGRIASGKKRKRGEKLRRNAFCHGMGANVYLTKSLYNRFRFAPFGIFTKTTITYLGVLMSCFIFSKAFGTPFPYAFAALAVGVFVFFRSMGNPLEEDTNMPLFIMIPENTWTKLFWSLAAGSLNCLLDILPAMVIGAFLTAANPLEVPGWILLILSVDLYGTIVAAFLNLSIPQSIGKVVKQVIQILFIYFGLLPDILFVILGIAFDHLTWGLLACAAVNLLFSLVFFLMTPMFLEPKGGLRVRVAAVSEEIKAMAKKDFSRLGLAMAMIVIIASLLQIAVSRVFGSQAGWWSESELVMYLITFLPIYLVAIPCGYVILRSVPAHAPERCTMKPLTLIRFMIYGQMLLYVGNLVGTLVNALIGAFVPAVPGNPLESYAAADTLWLKILFLVILAPILEEFIFRKCLIDRMRIYGEKTAVITSGLLFGLFHGNFTQFFYAASLGILFGYLYVRSGKLRYTIGLHMAINFLGSVLSVYLLDGFRSMQNGEFSILAIGFIAYALFNILNAIFGMVMLFIRRTHIHYQGTEHELGYGQILSTVWFNFGMCLMVLVSAVLFVVSALSIKVM